MHAKIGDIQVLRGIAIVMVLVYHLSISATAAAVWPVKITVPLYLGVEIFFVVSGFVITRSLMNDDFHAVRFFTKRVFRLMPALLLFIGLTLVLNRYVQNAHLSPEGKAMMSVSNRVFRQQARGIAFGYFNVVPSPASYANGAMWSLSVEDQFYVGVTLLCLAAGAIFRARPRWTGAVIAASATAFYLGLAGWRLATCGHIGDGPPALLYLTAWRFDFLGLGVMTAFIDRRFGERIRAVFRDSGTFCSALLLLLPLMLAAVCESPLAGAAPVLNGVCFVAIGLCFAGLVLLAANGLAFPSSRGPVYRVIKLIGDRSYTYYLFHFPIFIVAWLLLQAGFPAVSRGPWHYGVAQCIAVAALLVPFAEVTYRCLELPLADLGRQLAGKMNEAAARRNRLAAGNAHDKIGDIQVLRGLAILMVLICHLSIGSMALELWPVRVTIPLYLGVEIFFVVSGYVITRSLMKDGFHGGRFFLKRVFRLMPALLLFIGVSLLLNRYVQNAGLTDADKSFYSVPNRAFRQQARGVAFGYLTFVPGPLSHANGAMWSLSVEDQFYAAVTIMCLLAGGVLRFRPKWCGAVLAATAAAFYVCLVGWRLATWGDLEKMPSVIRYFVHWRFDFLGLGVVTAFIDRRWSERIRTVFRDSGTYCSAFLLLVPLMLATVCESPLQDPAPVLQAIGYLMFGLCFAGLVLLAANGLAFPASRGPLYRWLKFVGDRSYTYYLFHYPMFIVAFLLFHDHFQAAFRGPWHFAAAQCVTVFALLMPFSEAVYRCIELPIAELGRTLAGRMKSAGFGAAPHEREPVFNTEFGGESIVAGRCNPVPDGADVARQRSSVRRVA